MSRAAPAPTDRDEPGPARRTVLRGAAAAGAGIAVGLPLAADGPAQAATPTLEKKPRGKDKKKWSRSSGDPVAATEEIPVGSGKLFESDELIVTQPATGTFRGFSPFCTHQGCLVDLFENRQMICTCHSATYSIEDGETISGPTDKPLPRKDIVVRDGQVYNAVRR